MRNRLLTALLLLGLLLVTAACGQKPNVWRQIEGPPSALGGGLPAGATIDEEGNIVDAEGNVIGNVEEGITDPGALASGGTSTTTTGGNSTTGPGSSGGDDPNDPSDPGDDGPLPPSDDKRPSGNDVDEVIKMGIHAPLTGAAPVPSDSVDRGKDLYFRYMEAQKKRLPGDRRMEAVLKNDQYNPSTAVAVCKEMVENEDVFLLSGSAGTDQIQACARYAEGAGVPYISAGVTEALVSSFRTYFTTSMTYPDQAPLLVDYMVSKLGAKSEKNGMVFFDTASFRDGHDAFKAAASKAGMPIEYDKLVSKNAGTGDAQQIIRDLQLRGIQNVFVLTSPVFWINLSKAANAQGYKAQWTGVGISMTFDTVGTAACADGSAVDGAQFFSPFPAWQDRNRYDPEFDKAYNQFYGGGKASDDFVWLAWMGTKVVWKMFEGVGADLTRPSFIYDVERTRNLSIGFGPTLNYAPTDHFGADTVYVNRLSCSTRRWSTVVSPPTNNF